MNKLERRLAKLEAKNHHCEPKFNVWIDKGDGLMHGPASQTMTQEEFDTAFPDAEKWTLDIFDKKLDL